MGFLVPVTQLVVCGRTSRVSVPRKETYIMARSLPQVILSKCAQCEVK